MTALPPVSLVRQFDTHRLIPSRYSDDGASVLARIASDDAHLNDIFDLDHATNDRLIAENDLLPGIGLGELVFGVPFYRIINAAFCHAHPHGSRFNGPDRGAWYGGFELETSIAEVSFHKQVEIAEASWTSPVTVTYDDYLADFSGSFHDLRDAPEFTSCLAPDSYVASQKLAHQLMESSSLGVVYPSVRHDGGTCIACFRPAVVANVRKEHTLRLTIAAGEEPKVDIT
ncbi:RES family NAD+ phosphorylase [Aestuariivirga sp.]|uniref:RES family NAD+ phosphorylase n=1 Tax=Aestuariivirga sp. TaxID=2650926 RepID=UPI00391883B6